MIAAPATAPAVAFSVRIRRTVFRWSRIVCSLGRGESTWARMVAISARSCAASAAGRLWSRSAAPASQALSTLRTAAKSSPICAVAVWLAPGLPARIGEAILSPPILTKVIGGKYVVGFVGSVRAVSISFRHTITKYRYVLKPIATKLGRATPRERTANDVRRALVACAKDQSNATVAIAQNALTRAIRHAESRDKVRRNVSALIDTPKGQAGRPSKAMSIEQAQRLVDVASNLDEYRLGAYVVLCLQTGIRAEEARALRWEHVDLDGRPDDDQPMPPGIAVWRSGRHHGDTKTRLSRRTLSLPTHAVDLLREHGDRQGQARAEAGSVNLTLYERMNSVCGANTKSGPQFMAKLRGGSPVKGNASPPPHVLHLTSRPRFGHLAPTPFGQTLCTRAGAL